MTTPSRPEADMLHMQHAQMLAVICAVTTPSSQWLSATPQPRPAGRPRPRPSAAPARTTRKVRNLGPRPV